MIVRRKIPFKWLVASVLRMGTMMGLWSGFVFVLYIWAEFHFLRIPYLPVGTIGTAVAFYVGFKNNSAYDRFWEGRKIWGGVVNVSRSWGAAVVAYLEGYEGDDKKAVEKDLIYRHMAWINALRLQLRKNSRLMVKPSPTTRLRLKKDAEVMRNDWDKELSPFLSTEELAEVSARKNPATHLLAKQTSEITALVEQTHLNIFRQLEMKKMIDEMYTLQGKCERIKNTPLPRQYAELGKVFVQLFVLLIPFAMLDVFEVTPAFSLEAVANVGLMTVASAFIGWVFLTMEGVADASEDPFERSMNDVPMNALCRTIEIDLREMLGETDLPEKEKPSGIVLY